MSPMRLLQHACKATEGEGEEVVKKQIAGQGNRSRYLNGRCRCAPCKAANSAYVRERRARNPHPNALVLDKAAKRHLRKLRRQGVGLDSIQDVTGLGRTTISDIRNGARSKITRTTERLILSVTKDAYAGGARIPARKTIYMVKRLVREGFTEERLSVRLGLERSTIPRLVKRNTLVEGVTQMKVERFYNRLMLESEAA